MGRRGYSKEGEVGCIVMERQKGDYNGGLNREGERKGGKEWNIGRDKL